MAVVVWRQEREEAPAGVGLALVDPVRALEVLDDALRDGEPMTTLRCAELLGVTPDELERAGYG